MNFEALTYAGKRIRDGLLAVATRVRACIKRNLGCSATRQSGEPSNAPQGRIARGGALLWGVLAYILDKGFRKNSNVHSPSRCAFRL